MPGNPPKRRGRPPGTPNKPKLAVTPQVRALAEAAVPGLKEKEEARRAEVEQGLAVMQPDEREFVREYFAGGFNSARAEAAVGRSHGWATNLLADPAVKRLVQGEMRAVIGMLEVTKNKVLNELAEIGLRNPDAPLKEKIRSLELLGKELGCFREQLDVKVTAAPLTPEQRDAEIRRYLETAQRRLEAARAAPVTVETTATETPEGETP